MADEPKKPDEVTKGGAGEQAPAMPEDKGKAPSTPAPPPKTKVPSDSPKPKGELLDLTWRQWLVAGLLSLVAVGIAAGVPYLLWQGLKQARTDTAIVLPLMALGGMLAILASLTAASVVFRALGLSDKNEPIGLPLGTVRATLTLSLLGAFVLMAVFFYGDMSTTRTTNYVGINQTRLDAIPKEQVVSIQARLQDKRDESGHVIPDAKETVYDAEQRVEKSAASTDTAKQALTAVTTLMTTLVGFYVGSRVATGKAEKKDEGKAQPADGRRATVGEGGTQPPAQPQNEARGTNP